MNAEVNRPALRYFGGKWSAAPWIISQFPPHTTYVEPFAGAASVLLRRSAPAPIEILNDRARHIVTFFRVLRERPNELIELLEITPFAADEHEAAMAPTDDDVELARRFFVRAWSGFGGAPSVTARRGFRRCAYRSLAGEFTGAVENLYAVAARLRNVTIENRDWSEVVEKYDSPATLFYVDPPYLMRVRSEGRHDKGYGENEIDYAEHVKLLEQLSRCRGQIVLSGYADPLYEDACSGPEWSRHEKTVKGLQNGERTEVLWVRQHKRTAGPLFEARGAA